MTSSVSLSLSIFIFLLFSYFRFILPFILSVYFCVLVCCCFVWYFPFGVVRCLLYDDVIIYLFPFCLSLSMIRRWQPIGRCGCSFDNFFMFSWCFFSLSLYFSSNLRLHLGINIYLHMFGITQIFPNFIWYLRMWWHEGFARTHALGKMLHVSYISQCVLISL